MKLYGNETETILVTKKGIFLIQNDSMQGSYEKLKELPSDVEELGDSAFIGLEIPEELL